MNANPLPVSDEVYTLMGNHPESYVNGVWAYILGQYFPLPHFIVAPEYSTAGNGRADLLVIRVRDNQLIFALEGKPMQKTHWKWTQDMVQLRGYLESVQKSLGQGSTSYGMLAAGTDFVIVSWNGTQIYRLVSKITDMQPATNTQDINGNPTQTLGLLGALATALH